MVARVTIRALARSSDDWCAVDLGSPLVAGRRNNRKEKAVFFKHDWRIPL
jgi:hypothetical protein